MMSTTGQRPRRQRVAPRWMGALAGVAPAAVVLGWYLGTGGPIQPGLIAIVAAAVAAGWIVGPRATGPIRADAAAAVGYFLVAYALEAIASSVVVVWQDPALWAPAEAIRHLTPLWVARIVYSPVWAVFLSPAVLAWLLAVRALRGRLDQHATRAAHLDGPATNS
jgi:hypothetical protein